MISEPYLLKQMCAYAPNEKFVYMEYLNELVHYFQDGGLIDRWHELENQDSASRNIKSHLNRANLRPEIDSKDVIPTLVWGGWIASVVVFIFEIIWQKYGAFTPKFVCDIISSIKTYGAN